MFKKHSPLSLVLIMLAAAALACSLTRDKGEENTEPEPTSTLVRPTTDPNIDADTTTPPTVSIVQISPESPVEVNTALEIVAEAQHEIGATEIQLLIASQDNPDPVLVNSRAPAPEPTVSANLAWTPTEAGTYTIQVVALRGSVASEPAVSAIEVLEAGSLQPTATEAIPCQLVMNSTANLRSGPDQSFSVVGQISEGEQPTPIGRSRASLGQGWFKIPN